MAKIVRKKPSPKRKALASKVTVEGAGKSKKLDGTKEQLAALAMETLVKNIPKK